MWWLAIVAILVAVATIVGLLRGSRARTLNLRIIAIEPKNPSGKMETK